MNSKLQDLTEKIYQEGIEKAREESDRLIQEARSEADRIRQEAEAEKEQVISQAQQDAEALKKKVTSELQIAGRKLIGQLKADLAQLVQEKVVQNPVKDNLNDAATLGKLMELAVASVAVEGNELTLRVSDSLHDEVKAYLNQSKSQVLSKGVELHSEHLPGGGFKLEPKDGNFLISFTDADFRSFFTRFMNNETLEFLSTETA